MRWKAACSTGLGYCAVKPGSITLPPLKAPKVLDPLRERIRYLHYSMGTDEVYEHRVLVQLLYGTGMRIREGLQLQVNDVDFDRQTLLVREGKGGQDRAVTHVLKVGGGAVPSPLHAPTAT